MRRFLIALSLMVVGCNSPTHIVEEAIEAADRGDRSAYIACFTPRSKPLLRSMYSVADASRPTLGQMGQKGAVVASVQRMAPGDDRQNRVMVTVHEAGRSLPLVVHSEAGAWRIDLMDSERVLTGLGSPF